MPALCVAVTVTVPLLLPVSGDTVVPQLGKTFQKQLDVILIVVCPPVEAKLSAEGEDEINGFSILPLSFR